MDELKRVIRALNKANTFDTKLPMKLFALDGMSGIKTRIFYNEICSQAKVYLEVGSWKGSTLCAAGYGNSELKQYCIENWSLWGGPKQEFEENIKTFGLTPTIIEDDFKTVDLDTIVKEPIDVYMYDGDHSYEFQKLAITKMWPKLAETSIIIVDDWNNRHEIKQATLDGLSEVNAIIVEQFEIQYVVGPEHPLYDPRWPAHTPFDVASHEFWNGIGIFIVKKNPRRGSFPTGQSSASHV